MDMIRYNINFIFIWCDNVWVVWFNYVNVFCVYVFFYVKYIKCRNIFSDINDKFDVSISSFNN